MYDEFSKEELLAWDKSLHSKYKRKLAGQEVDHLSKEDIVNTHVIVWQEMRRRGFSHTIDDELTKASKQFMSDLALYERIELPDEIMILPNGIVMVGSAVETLREPNDVDILISKRNRWIGLEEVLSKNLPIDYDLHFVYDPSGPHGPFVSMYDIVARKRESLSIQTPFQRVDMFSVSPYRRLRDWCDRNIEKYGHLSFFIDEVQDGFPCILSREYDKVLLTSLDGIHIHDYDSILEEALSFALPRRFMLQGVLEDDIFTATDILIWELTETVDMSTSFRKGFLSKIPETDHIKVIYTEFYSSLTDGTKTLPDRAYLYYTDGRFDSTANFRYEKVFNVAPFTRFQPMKPSKWILKSEEIWEKWGEKHAPFAVEPKYDGMRMTIHLEGDRVQFITEDRKRDISHHFPKASAELIKKFGNQSLILDAEMLVFRPDGKPRPRSSQMEFIVGKKEEWDDENVKFFIFDLLYKGRDLSKLSYTQRRGQLITLMSHRTFKHFELTKTKIVYRQEHIETAIKWASEPLESEGAMLKNVDGTYENRESPQWAKWRKTVLVSVKVDRRVKKTGAEAWMYYCSYKDRDGSYHSIGRTYATSIDAKVGETLEVIVTRINKNLKDGKIFFSWIFPTVLRKNGEVITFSQLDTLSKQYIQEEEELTALHPPWYWLVFKKSENKWIKTNYELPHESFSLRDDESLKKLQQIIGQGTFHIYKVTKAIWERRHEIEGPPSGIAYRVEVTPTKVVVNYPRNEGHRQVELGEDLYMRTPKGLQPMVIQQHNVGDGVHLDVRMMADPSNGILVGWSLFSTRPNGSGKSIVRITNEVGMDGQKIQATGKLPQPRSWLNFEGDLPYEIKRTPEAESYVNIVQKGKVMFGKQEENFHEYFWKSDSIQSVPSGLRTKGRPPFNGRWILVKTSLKRRRDVEQKGEAAKEVPVWLLWKPKDQLPWYFTQIFQRQELHKIKPGDRERAWEIVSTFNLGHLVTDKIRERDEEFKARKLKLGAFDTIKFKKSGRVLIIEGVAIAEGTWTGIDGKTIYYSYQVLAQNASSLLNARLKLEHGGKDIDVRGFVARVWSNSRSKSIHVRLMIFDEEAIRILEESCEYGLSAELMADLKQEGEKLNAVRIHFTALALTATPACKVCWLDPGTAKIVNV